MTLTSYSFCCLSSDQASDQGATRIRDCVVGYSPANGTVPKTVQQVLRGPSLSASNSRNETRSSSNNMISLAQAVLCKLLCAHRPSHATLLGRFWQTYQLNSGRARLLPTPLDATERFSRVFRVSLRDVGTRCVPFLPAVTFASQTRVLPFCRLRGVVDGKRYVALCFPAPQDSTVQVLVMFQSLCRRTGF